MLVIQSQADSRGGVGGQGQAASSLLEELQDTGACLKKQGRTLRLTSDFHLAHTCLHTLRQTCKYTHTHMCACM